MLLLITTQGPIRQYHLTSCAKYTIEQIIFFNLVFWIFYCCVQINCTNCFQCYCHVWQEKCCMIFMTNIVSTITVSQNLIFLNDFAWYKQHTLLTLHMTTLYISWGWVVCLYPSPCGESGINIITLRKIFFDIRCEMIIKFLFRSCGKYSCICFSSVHILWFCIHTFAPSHLPWKWRSIISCSHQI